MTGSDEERPCSSKPAAHFFRGMLGSDQKQPQTQQQVAAAAAAAATTTTTATATATTTTAHCLPSRRRGRSLHGQCCVAVPQV